MTDEGSRVRCFLVTVTPGHELAQAFGHAAIAFEEGEIVAYSYGGYVLPKLLPRSGAREPWDMVGATSFETLLPVINRTLRATKVREPLALFKQRVGPFQRVLTDELKLTPGQCARLHEHVREALARIEPGEKTAGFYRYDHFANNCVTRLRDALFAAIHGAPNLASEREEIDLSYEQIIEESLADAIRASAQGVHLFPPAFEQALSTFLPGIPAVSRHPADFLEAARWALEHLSSTPVFSTDEGRQALAGALHLLNVEIPRRPRTFWESLFTPKRLRHALMSWSNPETGGALLAPEPIEGNRTAQVR